MTQFSPSKIVLLAIFFFLGSTVNQASNIDYRQQNEKQAEKTGEKKHDVNSLPIPVPPADSQDGGHHEHEDGHYTRFHFDRLPRRRRYSIILFGLIYLFLCCVHAGIIIYQSYHLIHTVQITSEKLLEMREYEYSIQPKHSIEYKS